MKTILWLLVFLLGFGAGYAVHSVQEKNTVSQTASADAKQMRTDLTRIREKFTAINENDIREYLYLKDQKAKYEKADEILGKIMLVLIADLGIKIERKGLVAQVTSTSAESLMPNSVQQTETGLKTSEKLSGETATAITPDIKIQNELKSIENRIDTISNSEGVSKFIEQTKIINLADVFSTFKPVRKFDEVFRDFLGTFHGDIRLYIEDQRSLPTTAGFTINGNKIDFSVNIDDNTMFKTDYSGTSNAEGFFENLGSGSKGVFLSVDHYSYKYLQLYYLPEMRMLVGNFYKKWERPGEYKCVGGVRLTKQ